MTTQPISGSFSGAAYQQVRRTASWIDSEALRRARLFVVPRSRSQASRVPFVVLVSVLLVGGVVSLLLFNTSMQQAAFSEVRLNQEATALAARQQTLELQLEKMQNPQVIAQRAQARGMVIPEDPAVLRVPSGHVGGVPSPATNTYTPPLWAYLSHTSTVAVTH